jgi:hypothetical protein
MPKPFFQAGIAAILLAQPLPAAANNLGENGAWQFRSPTDLANLTLVLDAIERKRAGGYAAPAYTTTIERQFNCGITASALGNSSAQTALANSPTLGGPSSSSQGNANDAENGRGGTTSSGQTNSGTVNASASGDVGAAINGSPYQAINATQTNTGVQTASVTGSTGCSFGALN